MDEKRSRRVRGPYLRQTSERVNMGLMSGLSHFLRRMFRQTEQTMSSEASDHKDQRISFHPSRGSRVRRSTDGATVYKKKKKCRIWSKQVNSLSFSNRSIAVDEIVMIHITNMAVIVGFMFQDPDSLPRIKSSFEILHRGMGFGVVLPMRPVTAVEFHYNRVGDVRFKVDGMDAGTFFRVVDRDVQPWIVIDMYNSTKNMSEMDADVTPLLQEARKRTDRSWTCDLCYAAPADARLGPCGHDSCCHSCAMKWLKNSRSGGKGCPYCRQEVNSVLRCGTRVEKEGKCK